MGSSHTPATSWQEKFKLSRAQIISVAQHKGGVGKTSITANLAHYFAQECGLRVLVVDLDEQCDVTKVLLGSSYEQKNGRDAGCLFERNGEFSVSDLVVQVENKPNLFVIPGRSDDTFSLEENLDLLYAEMAENFIPKMEDILGHKDLNINRDAAIELTESLKKSITTNRNDWQKILKKALSYACGDYDIILIDLPPAVSRIPKNAWVASDFLLTPISDHFSIEGTARLVKRMVNIKKFFNKELQFIFLFNKAPFVKNKYGEHMNKSFSWEMQSFYENINAAPYLRQCSHFVDPIRNSRDVETSNKHSTTVIENFPYSKVTQDIRTVGEQILNILLNK